MPLKGPSWSFVSPWKIVGTSPVEQRLELLSSPTRPVKPSKGFKQVYRSPAHASHVPELLICISPWGCLNPRNLPFHGVSIPTASSTIGIMIKYLTWKNWDHILLVIDMRQIREMRWITEINGGDHWHTNGRTYYLDNLQMLGFRRVARSTPRTWT